MRRAVVYAAAIALLFCGGAMEATGSVRPAHLAAAGTDQARPNGWRYEECRFKNVGTRAWSTRDVERMIRCVAAKEDPPGGAAEALSVYNCETGHPIEAPHSDPYHGPMQYLVSTFQSQYDRVATRLRQAYGKVVERVHNVRANITTAIVWAGRYGWGPWSCA
jgi:hypothetical protein